nr:MAG TPA: hypothetical protein [Caudoviricetes sp.]
MLAHRERLYRSACPIVVGTIPTRHLYCTTFGQALTSVPRRCFL